MRRKVEDYLGICSDDKDKKPKCKKSCGCSDCSLWRCGSWQLDLYTAMKRAGVPSLPNKPGRVISIERPNYYSVTMIDCDEQFVASFALGRVNAVLGYSCHLAIHESYRGTGLYMDINGAKKAIARLIGFKSLIATVESSNTAELKAATRAGWRVVCTIPGKHGPLKMIKLKL